MRQGTPLDETAVGRLLVDLLSVLAYVHKQNVIHRDIKPDNVILRRRDHKPVLIDFGIVKEVLRAGDRNPTHSMMAGTPGYVSPEQATGRPVFASDLYGLGATAIFLLTGKNPRCMTDPVTGRIRENPYLCRARRSQASICVAVLNAAGKLVTESVFETSAATAPDLLKGLRGQVEVTFEEDTHAAWLYDVLQRAKAQVIICDPRRSPWNASWQGPCSFRRV